VPSKVGGDLMLGKMAVRSIDVFLFYDECTDQVKYVLAENNDSKTMWSAWEPLTLFF
jgi:hypothetical protein